MPGCGPRTSFANLRLRYERRKSAPFNSIQSKAMSTAALAYRLRRMRRKAGATGNNDFAVDEERPGWKCRDRCRSERKAVSEVVSVASDDPTSPLTRVLQLMVSLKTRSFPVMSADGQLEGMISREDIMRALKETTQGS